MKGKLVELLESRGFPVYLQGSMAEDEKYPDSFFTYFNFDTPDGAFYDNDSHKADWGFWVYFYSNNPRLVESETKEVYKLLKESGFILQGRGTDANSDEESHTGRMLTAYYMEV